VFVKVVKARVDVFGARTEFGKTSQFEGTGEVILEGLAINMGHVGNDGKSFFTNFLNKKHDRKDAAERLQDCDVFGLCRGQGNHRLKFRCPDDGAAGVENNPTTTRFCGAWVLRSQSSIPVAGEVRVHIAIKSAIGFGREAKANILGEFQVTNKVKGEPHREAPLDQRSILQAGARRI
jgi:hypothetical protein